MILAGINYIEQQMTRCQLYLNRSVIYAWGCHVYHHIRYRLIYRCAKKVVLYSGI